MTNLISCPLVASVCALTNRVTGNGETTDVEQITTTFVNLGYDVKKLSDLYFPNTGLKDIGESREDLDSNDFFSIYSSQYKVVNLVLCI